MQDVKNRIKQARLAAGLTQDEMAKKIGLSRGAVGLWESARAVELPTIDNLFKIARACNVSAGWLVSGDVDNTSHITVNKSDIPVITWIQACEPELPAQVYESKEVERFPCPVAHSAHTYALRVTGQSMTSTNSLQQSYPDGCIIYCDTHLPCNIPTGTPVIAYLPDSDEATFKLYVSDGGKRWLESINERYERITDNFEIRSVVIGSFHFP